MVLPPNVLHKICNYLSAKEILYLKYARRWLANALDVKAAFLDKGIEVNKGSSYGMYRVIVCGMMNFKQIPYISPQQALECEYMPMNYNLIYTGRDMYVYLGKEFIKWVVWDVIDDEIFPYQVFDDRGLWGFHMRNKCIKEYCNCLTTNNYVYLCYYSLSKKQLLADEDDIIRSDSFPSVYKNKYIILNRYICDNEKCKDHERYIAY